MARLRKFKKKSRSSRSADSRAAMTHRTPSSGAHEPKRGVKLRNVGWFTMLVALVCLAAFMAGRSSAGSAASGALAPKAGAPMLRQNDAGGFLSRRRRHGKTGAQEIEKGARTGARGASSPDLGATRLPWLLAS